MDLTNVMAGPFCCYQLALLGAEVIKVEVPGRGDLARQLGSNPELNERLMGASFLAQNAGKKSVTLNLKDERGKRILKQLVRKSDALVESFRPGVMDRLAVGPDVLRAENPKLVYCSLSGFGQSGPLSQRPAYDQIIQGLAGLMSVTGDEASAPWRVGFPVSDAVAGLNAALSTAAGLVRAMRSGEGATIDVSMLDSSIGIAGWVVSNHLTTGETPMPMGNENRTASPSGTFSTGDGLLNIAANKQEQWEAAAKVAGLPELIDDPRFKTREDRKRNRYVLKELLETAFRSRPAVEWETLLNQAGVPSGRVLSVPGALTLPQVRHRELIRDFPQVEGIEQPLRVLNGGFSFKDEGRGDLAPPPLLGQDNHDILGELGLGEDEIQQLERDGVI